MSGTLGPLARRRSTRPLHELLRYTRFFCSGRLCHLCLDLCRFGCAAIHFRPQLYMCRRAHRGARPFGRSIFWLEGGRALSQILLCLEAQVDPLGLHMIFREVKDKALADILHLAALALSVLENLVYEVRHL